MERIKERLIKMKLQLVSSYMRLHEWLIENPRNMAIAAICFIAIIAGMVLLIRILPFIFATGLILWVFSDGIEALRLRFFGKYRLPNLEDNEVCFVVAKFMHKAICTDKPLDENAKTPSTVHDTYDNNDYRDLYNGVPMLKLRLIRKNRDKDPERDYLKIVLQTSVNGRLADGYLRGYSWAIPASNAVPLIKVAMLDYSDLYIHIGILLTNSVEVVNAARISDMPTLPQTTDDIDPLFMEIDGDMADGEVMQDEVMQREDTTTVEDTKGDEG